MARPREFTMGKNATAVRPSELASAEGGVESMPRQHSAEGAAEAIARKRPRKDGRDDKVSFCAGIQLTFQRPIKILVGGSKHDGSDSGSA